MCKIKNIFITTTLTQFNVHNMQTIGLLHFPWNKVFYFINILLVIFTISQFTIFIL